MDTLTTERPATEDLDPLCLCSHPQSDHAEFNGAPGACYCWKGDVPERVCDVIVWTKVGCDQFVESPYYCALCQEVTFTPESAIFHCVCRGCGHVLISHFGPGAILRAESKCDERACGCPRWGGAGEELAA